MGKTEAYEYDDYLIGEERERQDWDNYDDHESVSSQDKRQKSDDESSDGYEEQKLNIYQACGLNTMNMFGTGPFITIPFVVAAADPAGPHALIGYAMAAFACMNDSLVWSELGSIWPDSGGSYVYLRELYGRDRWGRLIAFLFVWQIMISGPMECASGFVATAQYIAYIDQQDSYIHHSLIAFGMCLATVWSLYREIDEVGTITLVLWAFTIAAIFFAIIAGYSNFDSEYIKAPGDAFDDPGKAFASFWIAARYAVYDFTGYYDVNFVGNEVQNPAETIPIACVTTCCVVAMVFFLVDIAVIGSLQWDGEEGYVKNVLANDSSANYIMATFCETHISRGFAIFFTIIVCITIFGSCFSFMIGLAQIPYTAAKDGYFYAFLAHEHEHYKGLQDYSLLFVGGLSTIFCFMSLDLVIEGMLTMQLAVQFMGQGWGLIWYRYFTPVEDQEIGAFTVPLFPLPNIIQLVVFGMILGTTQSVITGFGEANPLMEIAIGFILSGVLMYLLWARSKAFWPFNDEYDRFEEELDHMVVFHDDYEHELKTVRKKVKEKDNEIARLKLNTKGITAKMDSVDEEIDGAILKLGQEEYQILSYLRKIVLTESKISELLVKLSDREKELHETKQENSDLQYKTEMISKWWSHSDERNFDMNKIKQKKSETIQTGIFEGLPVTEWTVDEVFHWWRVTLPPRAQRHIELVKECQLTGHDLLSVDEEMLEQYGMKKVVSYQVLKQIDLLKKSLESEHRNAGSVRSKDHKSHLSLGTVQTDSQNDIVNSDGSRNIKADPSKDGSPKDENAPRLARNVTYTRSAPANRKPSEPESAGKRTRSEFRH